MAASNVEAYRAGHEAFNRREFEAMTNHYADSIAWTDHAQGWTFRTPREFKEDFLPGWVDAVVGYLLTRPGADTLFTSCADGPGPPRGFYLRYGFADTGRVMWGENVLALDLRRART